MAFPLLCTGLNPLFSSLFPLGLGWSFLELHLPFPQLLVGSQLEKEPRELHSHRESAFKSCPGRWGWGPAMLPGFVCCFRECFYTAFTLLTGAAVLCLYMEILLYWRMGTGTARGAALSPQGTGR